MAFDKKSWMREYMKKYMEKRRKEKPEDIQLINEKHWRKKLEKRYGKVEDNKEEPCQKEQNSQQ